ncbi:MAG: hypothetical protein A3I66_02705 [Burkholderiales bacterium RIFCSPLOWO2_02_FULL_57_36]|nr:MAG: hypothetical protein A3I66_02705 [Burkholderiales bacterium RIFCSPLOWO2_02_FULL_57_36]
MKKLMTKLVLGFAAVGFTEMSAAIADERKAAYYAIADKAAADYRDAHAACDALDGNAQIVCIEEAKLAQTRTKGNAEAQYRNTAQARQKTGTDIANAEYAVAKARCESKEGNDKSACIRHAYALRIAAIAAAKAAQTTANAGTGAR